MLHADSTCGFICAWLTAFAMNSRAVLLTALAGAAIAGLAWFAAHQGSRTTSTNGKPVAESIPGQDGSVARTGAVDANHDLPTPASHEPVARLDEDRPFATARPDLEQRARNGDAHAATLLARTLSRCNHYVPSADSLLEQWVVDLAASGGSVTVNKEQLSPDETLSMLKLGYEQLNRDCRGVSGLNEADAPAKAFEWIERAAALGDADAQALYGQLAFATYEVRTAVANAEEIRERKRLALEYLQRSLARGDALALRVMSEHYTKGPLLAPDAQRAYAYLYAYSLTPRSQDLVPELLELLLAQTAHGLDPASLEQARESGRQLATCCQSLNGDGP